MRVSTRSWLLLAGVWGVLAAPRPGAAQSLLDSGTAFDPGTAEATINEPLPDRRLRNADFLGSNMRGTYYLRMFAESAGANTKALDVSSDRTMVATLKPKVDATLQLLTYLKAELERASEGKTGVEASVVVERKDGAAWVEVLKVDSTTDAGHWKHERAADGILAVDDSWFPTVDVAAGKEYRIRGHLQASTGTVPVGKAGKDLLDVWDEAKEHQFNVVWALRPKTPLLNWRGADGVNAILARALEVTKVAGGAARKIDGTDIKIGMFETGSPVAAHTDINVDIVKGGKFAADADGARYRSEHATAVGGVLAADNADANLAGIAPKAQIVSASRSAATGAAAEERVRDALDAMHAKGARIVNFSWGDPNALAGARINREVNKAVVQKDMIVVAYAGNSGELGGAPGNAHHAIRVGGLDRSFRKVASFSADLSGAGMPPHLLAPAEYITTTVVPPLNAARSRLDANPPNDYDSVFYGCYPDGRGVSVSGAISGTSFSSPMVAGTVALMHELMADHRYTDKLGAAKVADMKKKPYVQSVLMTTAGKTKPGTALKLLKKDGKEYDPVKDNFGKVQDAVVYDEIGAGVLNGRAALNLMLKERPVIKAVALPGDVDEEDWGGPLDEPDWEDFEHEFAPDDEHDDWGGGFGLPHRFYATGYGLADVLDMAPGEQFEVAIPIPMREGYELTMTASWLLQHVSEFDGDPDGNMNLGIALLRDLDAASGGDPDGIGSDLPLSYSVGGDGLMRVDPVQPSGDEFVVGANGGWETAEHLHWVIQEEGYYYLRVLNLSPSYGSDAFAYAARIVPEPATVLLLASGGLLWVRRRVA